MRTWNKKKRPKHYTKPKWKLKGRNVLKVMSLNSVHMKNKARYFSDNFPLPVHLFSNLQKQREMVKRMVQIKKEISDERNKIQRL